MELYCIGKKCQYCYDADFYNSMLICTSQSSTFAKSSYAKHRCTIDDEILAEKIAVFNRVEYRNFISDNQE